MEDGKQETTDKQEEKPSFDKEKQKLEISQANEAKARAERDAAKAELEAARATQRRLDDQLGQLEAERDRLAAEQNAAKAFDNTLPDVDVEEATVEDLAHVAKASKKVIADLKKEVASLKQQAEKDRQKSESERQAAQAKAEQDRILNKLMSRFEKKYGVGHRNASLELFESKQASGDITNTMGPAEVALALEDCYEQCATRKKPGSKHATTDPLSGGSPKPTYTKPTIKPGSLEEVREQFAKAASP